MVSGYRIGILRPLLMLVLLLASLPVFSLTLGDMVVRSLPGGPLRAHIPLTLQVDESLTDIKIVLATAEQYAQRHISYAESLQGMSLALLGRGEGKARLQFFGEQPWQGEAVQLLLMIDWPKGQMELPYKIAAVNAAHEAAPVYVEVGQNESLDEIAIRLSKGRNRSYLHMMYALFQANPEAFYRGNMNNLKSGKTLRVPTEEELYRLSDREVFGGIRQQYEQWQLLRESTQQRGTQAGEALAGMSSEQTAKLDLSGSTDTLQQQLQQVNDEGEVIRKENEALRQRLLALEQRMQSVAGQVLDYAESDVTAMKEAMPVPKPEAKQEPEPVLEVDTNVEEKIEAEPEEAKPRGVGLSASALFAAIVVMLLVVGYIWRSTATPHRELP